MNCKWKSKTDNNLCCSNEISNNDDYCIIHKINKTKEENEMQVNYIKEKEIKEIVGFVFEEEFSARDTIKYKYDELVFREVVFLKNANFKEFEFRKKVIFENVKFLNGATFKNSRFLESCIFRNCYFNKKLSQEKIFLDTLFIGQNLELYEVENLPRLDGIKFDGHTKIIMKLVEYNKSLYVNGKINYRIARNQANKIGDYERIGYYYYKERYYGSKSMKKEDYPTYEHYLSSKFFDRLSKTVIGYGEKPWNVLITTLLTISIFAIIYMFVGVRGINNEMIQIDLKNISDYSLKEIINIYLDLWYFSMTTFSTVGFGDMIVMTQLGKMFASIEVFFGVTIGATWTSVIIKRLIK